MTVDDESPAALTRAGVALAPPDGCSFRAGDRGEDRAGVQVRHGWSDGLLGVYVRSEEDPAGWRLLAGLGDWRGVRDVRVLPPLLALSVPRVHRPGCLVALRLQADGWQANQVELAPEDLGSRAADLDCLGGRFQLLPDALPGRYRLLLTGRTPSGGLAVVTAVLDLAPDGTRVARFPLLVDRLDPADTPWTEEHDVVGAQAGGVVLQFAGESTARLFDATGHFRRRLPLEDRTTGASPGSPRLAPPPRRASIAGRR